MYDLYQQGPGALFGTLAVSLVLTLLLYGAIPMLVALLRSSPITKKKYKWICYGWNAALWILVAFIGGSASSAAPYLLWTSVFMAWGSKILKDKGLFQEVAKGEMGRQCLPGQVTECMGCGYRGDFGNNGCPRCGGQRRRYVYPEPVDANGTVAYCPKCGAPLQAGQKHCIQCGQRIAP